MTMTIIDKNGKLKDLHASRADNLFTAVMELQHMKDREERERKEREEREEATRRYELEKAGIDPDAPKEVDMDKCPSGIPERPYCTGRNYDPNRYSRK